MEKENNNAIIVFQNKKIRRIWFNDKWYFSIVDVVNTLTDSEDPRKYWNKLNQRLREEGSEVVTFCHQLKLIAEDGKLRETDCADTEGIFRIIQSIPSKKAEPFKRWLAQVGYDRVKEIEDPELAQKRMKEIYRAKGYSDAWIEKRVRGIVVRDELTDQWKKRDVGAEREYSILTAEISKATFGMTPSEYKELKGLKRENLRDHMTDWELILTMFGEKATTDITLSRDAKGFEENKKAAQRGGQIAHNARKELEEETGKSVISKENFLYLEKKKQLEQN